MISKDIKTLSRKELVDIIYQLKKNEEQLQGKIAELEEALQDKRMRLSVAGSIAEAAMTVTNVFSTAQVTADLYLQEIACMKAEAGAECAKLVEEAKQSAAQILSEGMKKQAELDAQYEATCQALQQLKAELSRLEQTK